MTRILDTTVHLCNAKSLGRKARILIVAPWRLCAFALVLCVLGIPEPCGINWIGRMRMLIVLKPYDIVI